LAIRERGKIKHIIPSDHAGSFTNLWSTATLWWRRKSRNKIRIGHEREGGIIGVERERAGIYRRPSCARLGIAPSLQF